MSITVASRADFLTIAAGYAAQPDDWPVAPRFDPHQRWYHRLAQTDDHEVWLLTWLPGQSTDLHDHGGAAGAMLVESGQLTEDSYQAEAGRLVTQALSAGTGRRFGPHHIHRVSNRGDRPAVSVHVYGPALTTMTRYRLDAGGLTAVAVERAGVAW
ncbi:MAG TPA: cysteine dioxygenase family protein [Natronosporangium sp.]